MSNANPIQTAFDLQRTALEQTQNVTHEAVEAQKAAVNAMVDGAETAESLADQNARLTKEALHAYFDAVEQATPADAEVDFDQARELVDEQFEAYDEAQAESWSAVHEALAESADGFEQFADEYVDAVDESFDTFLDAHEEVESSAVDAAEEIDVSAA
ncbi:hypothetical protein ACFQDG_07040 [Natronoarchaeum mannanilyticum]|uniref:Phasin domain-containing protein n=1 Tax=Natronoarchaeum mannanilyticum TaxID=926360 RepID=A0AAV3TA92_9EURY